MNTRSPLLLAIAAGGTALAAEPASTIPAALASLSADAPMCGAVCSHTMAQEGLTEVIRATTFWSLPREHRGKIVEALAARGESIPMLTRQVEQSHPQAVELMVPLTEGEFDAAFAKVEQFTDRDTFARFNPMQQRMVSNFAEMATGDGWVPVAPCFTPGVDFAYVELFDTIVSYGLSNLNRPNIGPDDGGPDDGGFDDDGAVGTFGRFEQTGRWGATALDPSGGGQGNPTVLTYSFPPDGTTVPPGVGEPSGPNNLNAFLDSRYGTRDNWRGIYDAMFARWGELSGNTYVLEPNDDGAALDFQGFDSAPGVAGVRGDLRMVGKFIDGNSGTLAYNFFPQNGDMVIDTGDNFYNGSRLRLENVLSHEHGHGMGQLHTCPVTNSKLMEPFINLNFDGPQFDDILNAQRHYGDPFEPNDGPGVATALGSFGIDEETTIDTVSIDDDLDVDVYSFTLQENSEVTVRMRPQGFLYQAGPQTGNCNESQPYNPLLFLDPEVELIDGNGFTVIASADDNPEGFDEEIRVSLAAGDYFIRAIGNDPTASPPDQIIAYELDLQVDFDALSFVVVDEIPQAVDPGVETTFDIEISPDGEQIVGTPTVLFAPNPNAQFSSANLVNVGGDIWRVTLPPFDCGDQPVFRLTANGSVDGIKFFPASGTFDALVGQENVSFDDNGQVNLGYTAGGDAADGGWTLGVPVNNGRGDPASDFDGSGSCWLTDNTSVTDNSDVDDGEVVLTSPALDLVAGSEVSFAYWLNDIAGGPLQGGDSLRVQVSTNGGASYATVRTYTTALGSWRTDVLIEGVDFAAADAGQGRLRFIANDIGAQNVVEAGIDAIRISSLNCEDPVDQPCSPADLAAPFGIVDIDDVDAFIAAFIAGDAVADLAPPIGIVDIDDVDTFISLFLAGCP